MLSVKQEYDNLIIEGEATYNSLPYLMNKLKKAKNPINSLDIRRVLKIDTSSALFILDFVQLHNATLKCSDKNNRLFEIVRNHMKDKDIEHPPDGLFYNIGKTVYYNLVELYLFFGFVGEIFVHLVGSVTHPKRFRPKAIVNDIEKMGLNAVPIISVLSLLIGVVMAYQGSVRLKEFGANIFIVDLVSISIARELGPLIVAILLAGRSASSYTAQIGIMKVTEEIDVIKTMGLHPFDVMVFPKIISMIISLPLLVILADIMGIFGGAVVAHLSLNITFYDFFLRLKSVFTLNTFLAGLIKAPVFAFMIAMIGCFKGFRTQKNVESIGKNVTISVVDSIFAVIVIDAIFSIIFRWVGI